MKLKFKLFFLVLSLSLLVISCDSKGSSVSKETVQNKQADSQSDSGNSISVVKNYNGKLEISDLERAAYRSDIKDIFESIELVNKLPIYSGFDEKNEIQVQHINLIKKYLQDFKSKAISNVNNEDANLAPIVNFISIEPTKKLIMAKTNGSYYYTILYYSSVIDLNRYKDSNNLRGSFDGLIKWVLQIENKGGNWAVKDFGPDN